MNRREDEVIARGRAAWNRLRHDQSWNDYMELAEALAIGRDFCLAATEANDLDNKLYRNEFGKWLEQNGLSESQGGPDKVIRSLLLKCLNNRASIEKCRQEIPSLRKRLSLNSPAAMLRYWYNNSAEGRAFKEEEDKEKPARRRAVEKAEREKGQVDWAMGKVKELVTKTGDWEFDKPETIAEKLVEHYPSRALEVAEMIVGGNGPESSGNGFSLDWEAPEPDLQAALLAMIPLDRRAQRVLRNVASAHSKLIKTVGADSDGTDAPSRRAKSRGRIGADAARS